MSRLEASVERKFVSRMVDAEWDNAKMDQLKRGWSDQFFFGYEGRVEIVEFKREGARKGRRGEKLQDYMRQRFRRKGFRCHKVVTEIEADLLCERLCRENLEAKRRMQE